MFRKIFQTLFSSKSKRLAMKHAERPAIIPSSNESAGKTPYPADFFTRERIAGFENSLAKLRTIENPRITMLKMKNASKIKVDFSRDGKKYTAYFSVKRESNGISYHMHTEVCDEKEKIIFKKDRSNLDYSQVEPALLFVFHQAFAPENA